MLIQKNMLKKDGQLVGLDFYFALATHACFLFLFF